MRTLEKLVILGVTTCLVAFLALSVYAQGEGMERRIYQHSQQALVDSFKVLANSLREGELVLWVKTDDVVVVVAHGQVLGEVRIPIQDLVSSESFPVTFFNPIDDLLQKKLGKTINAIRDIYLLFETGVDKQTIHDYQRTFYHQKVYYCQSCNCCSKEHGYECCPRTIDMWYVPWGFDSDDKGINSATAAIAKLRSVSSSVVSNIIPIVVADDSLKKWGWADGAQSLWDWLLNLVGIEGNTPPLIRWLKKQFPATPIIQYDVSYDNSDKVYLTPRNANVSLPEGYVALLIVVIHPPAKTQAERNLMLAEVVGQSIEDIATNQPRPKVILFATAHPNSDFWDVVSEINLQQFTAETNPVIWKSPGPQPVERLADVVDSLKKDLGVQGNVVVRGISLKLQLLGFLPVWEYSETLQK